MAYNWFGPMVTAVVSALGIGFTYKAGQRQTETALHVSKEQAEAALRLQREERLQRRLEMAYEELFVMLAAEAERARPWAPFWHHEAEDPSAGTTRRYKVADAIWSPRVQQLMEPWSVLIGAVMMLGLRLAKDQALRERGEEAPDELTHQDQWEDRVNALGEADAAIRQQVWLELRGLHDGSAEPERPERWMAAGKTSAMACGQHRASGWPSKRERDEPRGPVLGHLPLIGSFNPSDSP